MNFLCINPGTTCTPVQLHTHTHSTNYMVEVYISTNCLCPRFQHWKRGVGGCLLRILQNSPGIKHYNTTTIQHGEEIKFTSQPSPPTVLINWGFPPRVDCFFTLLCWQRWWGLNNPGSLEWTKVCFVYQKRENCLKCDPWPYWSLAIF